MKSKQKVDSLYLLRLFFKFENTKPFTITKLDDVWVVEGDEISKLFAMTKFTEDESIQRF